MFRWAKVIVFKAMSSEREHIRKLIFDQFKLGNSASDAAKNICAVTGRRATTRSTCWRWFERFRSGSRLTKDKGRSGRPSTLNKRLLRKTIECNPVQTTRELATEFQCSHMAVYRGLKNLGKSSKSPTTVPHDLTEDQKNRRVSACKVLLHLFKRGGLDRILTCDEKWVRYDNRQAKKQWLGKNDTGILTPKPELHQKKVLLSVWWMCDGPVYWELLPPSRTITASHYCQQLDKVQRKLAEKGVDTSKVFFHQDNARPHTAQITLSKIEKLGWKKINHPPYSPDIAPSDYHLFRSMDNFFRGKRFLEADQIREALHDFFNSKSNEFYTDGIRSMREKWKKVIINKGNYFI